MFIKYCDSNRAVRLITENSEFNRFKKFAANLVNIDTDKYIYLINESVHAMEHYGPNANGDAFGLNEMKKRYHTFIGSRVSVDHRDEQIIGEVFDSVFVDPKVSGKGQFCGGGFVENILGVNKVLAGKIRPGIIDKIMNGEISDTSMGAIVAYTECSIPTCRHIAYTENDYCEHILGGKNRDIKLASGETCKVYEICHGVTWFEDSIIVPLHMGGLAGGEGADPDAKVLNIITSTVADYENDISHLLNTVKKTGSTRDYEVLNLLLDSILVR